MTKADYGFYVPVKVVIAGLFLIFLSAFMASFEPVCAFEGPLQSRNQFPLFMHADAPGLESARTGDSFSASFYYSSVFMSHQSQTWNVQLDMEVATLELQYKKDIGRNLELGISIPVISFNSGFMDGFLHDFHKTFGFADYGRSARPRNELAYEVRNNGQLMIRGQSGTGLGDIRLTAKKMIFTSDPAVSVSASLELPTGDASKGYGNGSLDAGLSVLVDKRLGENLMSYFNAGVIFPGNIKAEQTINLKESFFAGAGLEYLVSPHFGLLGQAIVQTSPFPKTGIGEIDRTGVILVFGGRYTKAKDSIEFSMTEDPNTAGATDFTVNVLYKRRF